MKLSSSNGTQLTIEELTKACELLNRARTRIKEINKGKYNGSDSLRFTYATCQELEECMKNIKIETRNLDGFVKRIEKESMEKPKQIKCPKQFSQLEDMFDTHEKCMEFKDKLEKASEDGTLYWENARGYILRESEFDEGLGNAINYVTLNITDLYGMKEYENEHIFKFVVNEIKGRYDNDVKMYDSIHDALYHYMRKIAKL